MNARPEVAMILAAGRGVRMRPLSDVVPKPALELPEGPVVSWALHLAASAGVDRIVVNASHLAEDMEEAVRRTAPPHPAVSVSREPELMGTAGGLAVARERGMLGRAGPVLVINGDCIVDLDLEPLFEAHRRRDDLVTLGLTPNRDPSRWSTVHLDREGTILAIEPPSPHPPEGPGLLYPGVMVVSRTSLESVPARPGDVPRWVWEPADRLGRFGGAELTGTWTEVGVPDAYLRAVLDRLGGSTDIRRDAGVERSATVERSLVLGGAEIRAGARVTESVIGRGVEVGKGARVEGCVVLGASAFVRPGERLTGVFRV